MGTVNMKAPEPQAQMQATLAPAAAAADPRNGHIVLLGRLLKLSNLVTRPFFVFFAERYDLSLNELRVLMILASMERAAAHELCEATGMHPMNVSRAVATLRRNDRISAQPDPDNRRRKILSLTPRGRNLHRMLVPHVTKISDFLFESMSPLEVEFLGKLMSKLVRRLDAVDASSPLLIDERALSMPDSGDGDETDAAARRTTAKRVRAKVSAD